MLRMLLARLQLLDSASSRRQVRVPAAQAGAQWRHKVRAYCDATTEGQHPTVQLSGDSPHGQPRASEPVSKRIGARSAWLDYQNSGSAPGQPPRTQQQQQQQQQHQESRQPQPGQPQAWSTQAAPASLARRPHIVASSAVAEDTVSASYASQLSSPTPLHQQQLPQPAGPPDFSPRPSSPWQPPPIPLPHGQPLQPRPRSANGTSSLSPSPSGSAARSAGRPPTSTVSGSNGSTSSDVEAAKRLPLYVRPSELPLQEKLQMLVDKLAEQEEIEVDRVALGTHRCVCPECGNGSKGEDCFSVTLEEDQALWCCHRATCGSSGGLSIYGKYKPGPPAVGMQSAAGGKAGVAEQRSQQLSMTDHITRWQVQKQLEQHPVARDVRTNLQPLNPELLAWLKGRGISEATLQRNGVAMETRYSSSSRSNVEMIAFPYFRNGAVVNVKYRGLPKEFTQVKGGERIFYGFDDIKGQSEVIIVEGEMDKLALEEAGYTNVISVPTGARISKRVRTDPLPAPEKDTEFSYVHNCWDVLSSATKIVLATDNDDPGTALADELARRLGREKCWRVQWPKAEADGRALAAAMGIAELAPGPAAPAPGTGLAAGNVLSQQAGQQAPPDSLLPQLQASQQAPGDSDAVADAAAATGAAAAAAAVDPWFRKDANEVLMKDGAAALRAYVEGAQPLPIKGLFRFHAFWGQVYDLYQQGPRGLSWGMSTGWEAVDEVYKIVPGELTIVTGVPNSGKSEWLDALAMNLAKAHGWSFALCSMENRPPDHARKLMEKYAEKPFFDAAYASSTPRMGEKEVLEALVWIDERFHVIKASDEELPTIEWVLDKARSAVLRHGIRGLIIDPYNEISHTRPGHFSETDYVSQMLTKVKRFAQHYDCHVWFVAHPRQMSGWRGGAPNLYDISGSAHFINKADNGIVVHRPNTAASAASSSDGRRGGGDDIGDGDPRAVQVLVRKVRNKLAGRIGDALLRYNRTTGCYEDFDPPGSFPVKGARQ